MGVWLRHTLLAGRAGVCRQHGEGHGGDGGQLPQPLWRRPIRHACRHATGACAYLGCACAREHVCSTPVACCSLSTMVPCCNAAASPAEDCAAGRTQPARCWPGGDSKRVRVSGAMLTAMRALNRNRGSRRTSRGYTRCRTPRRWSCRGRGLGWKRGSQRMGVPPSGPPRQLPETGPPSRVMSRFRGWELLGLCGGGAV